MKQIERDDFPIEFLSKLAERESWRKEIHRPVYHVHKWWAKRLGSVFRGIVLGSILEDGLEKEFYSKREPSSLTVFDPFMGSGTTIGEAHKLGLVAIGRDINPVAVRAVNVALGRLDASELVEAFNELNTSVGTKLTEFYKSRDSKGQICDVLYFFWVMTAPCSSCNSSVDLFSSRIFARNAYPDRKPEVQVSCPYCDEVFRASNKNELATCPTCHKEFDPKVGNVAGKDAECSACGNKFPVANSFKNGKPKYRLYAKLVLTESQRKEYLRITDDDLANFEGCRALLQAHIRDKSLALPSLKLENGHNTNQALRYGFKSWRDFFNDRQLLGLLLLQGEIIKIADDSVREALLVLFSGVLEFNNLFTSYKGEGTGAVRHMFSHHVLKPEKTPIEANLWGTVKSSGSFSGLFRSRLLRAVDYRLNPVEIQTSHQAPVVASKPFSGVIDEWRSDGLYKPGGIYLSAGDSARTELASESVDLVITDPPFFDNVHYSELADFFQAWHSPGQEGSTSRHQGEVQDTDPTSFSKKLQAVFQECNRVLKSDGIMAFSYHHSRNDGWKSLASAIFSAGFIVTNAHPVKSEMSSAMPKQQAASPIQIDIIIVCRKLSAERKPKNTSDAIDAGWKKIRRLQEAGFRLSENDCRVIFHGQLLTSIQSAESWDEAISQLEKQVGEIKVVEPISTAIPEDQLILL